MKGIFHPDHHYHWDYPLLSAQEIRELDPIEDRYYLEYAVQYAMGARQKLLMKKLGISELPGKRENPEDPSDIMYEEYFILNEQVAREPDAQVLKEAAYEAPEQMARFAFCYLTKYYYPSPWNDAYSYRSYECGWKEGMTTEDVIAFCREMIEVQGPFAREAMEILKSPPGDHNDYAGKRMVSHERAMSEPPYVRKERLAPFRESEEYEQARAEVLGLEAQGHEALAAGEGEKAAKLFLEMSRKSEQMGKYTQRWDAIDDYARSCIAIAEVSASADHAVEAAGILRRLIRECPGEKAYAKQQKEAEAVYRKAVKETALQTGFVDEESPILEVFCKFLEERYRKRGGRREIEFRWQEPAPPAWETYGQAKRGMEIRSENSGHLTMEIFDDTEQEIGDICCCDLPTMIKLYDVTGNIVELSPFIDTDNLFPELLEQSRFEWDVCGLPVLVFDRAAEGFEGCFAIMNMSTYGLKWLDCLDLLKLMTDHDFLSDVCEACNAGEETEHVYPADRTICDRPGWPGRSR